MKRTYQTWEIKEALLELAQLRGRQHYEMAVINQVVKSFRDDVDCFLKDDVIDVLNRKHTTEVESKIEIEFNKNGLACEEKYSEFLGVCKSYVGAMTRLSELSGFSVQTISKFCKKGKLFVRNYNKMKPHFKTVLRGKPK
jgi:hypothetical protein